MFRSVEDFETEWKFETENTLKVFERLTPDSLSQQVIHGGRSMGIIAWHMALSIADFAGRSGLRLTNPEVMAQPFDPMYISIQFKKSADELVKEVNAEWLDSMLDQEFLFFGRPMMKGYLLSLVILHLAHHRGQLTVLMRQAGLTVPGVYGPSKEEWASLGLEATR